MNKPFMDKCLFYLNIFGFNPENETSFSKIRRALAMLMSFISITAMLLDIVTSWTGIASLLNGADSLVAFVQIYVKMIAFILLRRNLLNILNDLRQFWPVEEEHDSVRTQIKAIYGSVEKVITVMKIILFMINFSFYIQPFFMKRRVFPLKFYQPIDLTTPPRYEILFCFELFNSLQTATFLLGFDILFIALITHVVCELKILKHRFSALPVNYSIEGDEQKCLQEFGRLVNHHSFVLQFIKQMNNFYSLTMLGEFLSSLFCVCLSLFSLSGEGFPPRTEIIARCASYLICFGGELLIYCVGGDLITVESLSVADAVYGSDWWMKTQPRLRKGIVLVLMRAQKAEKITVGGMFDLNLESFASVMRTGFSFFTLMNAVYTDEV